MGSSHSGTKIGPACGKLQAFPKEYSHDIACIKSQEANYSWRLIVDTCREIKVQTYK